VRIGILSDAHGNAVGLAACLRALRHAGADALYFLGDAVGYFPDARGVLRLLRRCGAVCQQGNHEAMLLGRLPLAPEKDAVYRLAPVRETLSAAERETMAAWPERREVEIAGRRLLLVHGTPADPLQGYCYPDTDLSAFEGVPYDAVFMGHTHHPFVRRAGETLVVNVGSCGLPRDQGDLGACALYDAAAGTVRLLRVEFDAARVRRRYGGADVASATWDCLRRLPRGEVAGERNWRTD
jgi:putative phosphoesterase